MSRSRPSRRRGLTGEVTDVVLGGGARRRLVEQVVARLPFGGPAPLDPTGWSVSEFHAARTLPVGVAPPRRAGREAAAMANRLAGVLPLAAVPLARSITDAAPPAGQEMTPTLRDVLDRYLPETLTAFNVAAPPQLRGRADELLLSQLALLRQATTDLLRAQADNDDRALRIQDAFLRERFAELTPGSLDLPREGVAPQPRPARPPGAPRPAPPASAPLHGHAHVRADADPVVLLNPDRARGGRLGLRLGLPKGVVATLGVVQESHRRVIDFRQVANRRHLTVPRPTGFRASQVDVNIRIASAQVRRFLVYATSPGHREPTPTVLFVRDNDSAQADLPTLLTHEPRTVVTVIASGYSSPDGLLLRNESLLYPDLRSACEAFGYDRVEWLDGHSPIV